MRAKQAKVLHWMTKDLDLNSEFIGLNGSPTQVVKIFTPPQRPSGKMLQGEPQEIAEKLVEIIKPELH